MANGDRLTDVLNEITIVVEVVMAQTQQYRFPEPIEVVVSESARTQPWAETARTWPPTPEVCIEADYELRGCDTYETLVRDALSAL